MSITPFLRLRIFPPGLLGQLRSCSSLVKEAAKPSGTAIPNAASTPFPLDKAPPAPISDRIKVSVQKPNLTKPVVVVDDVTKSASFDTIPGPVTLKVLSKIWSVIPVIDTQVTGSVIQYALGIGNVLSWSGNMTLFRKMINHYGPVTRLHGPFGGDVVILTRAEDIETVFKNEGPYPIRATLDCVEKYRLQCRKYKNVGPFLMFGPEWERFRKSVEQPLQVCLTQQYDKIEENCEKFLERVKHLRNRQAEVPGTFYKEIHKWCLECLFSVILNKRLGFLDPCGLSSTSDPGELLEGFIGATNAIKRCEYGLHFWKFIKTPAWRSLVKNCDVIDSVLSKYIQRVHNELRDKKERAVVAEMSLLEVMLLKHGIMVEDAMTILLDLMLIGINATSHTIAFLFYHLSKYPKCQAKLYKEITKQPAKLSKDALLAMPYLQACIRETLRLTPPVPVMGRVLSDDITVHNYHIPKGTYLLMITSLSGLKEEYFEDAHKFLPERWLNQAEEIPTFASIPFGYGPRACLAKELVEMEIGILLTKVLRSFRIEYLYGEIESTNRLLAAPNKQLKFRFVERA